MTIVRSALEKAVRSSATAQKLKPADKAALELALTYARDLDQGGDLAKIGPQLLRALEALGITPAARAALIRGTTTDDKPTADPVDQLRARRAARQRDTATVDAAAP